MRDSRRFKPARRGRLAAVLLAVSAVAVVAAPGSDLPQGWPGYGRDPQHSALGNVATQVPKRIRWSTAVDLNPQYTGPNQTGDLLTHYGSPIITRLNNVLVPVKTGADGGFRLEGHRASDGLLLWTQQTDYVLPAHNWIPPFAPTLTPKDKSVVLPGAGGTVLVRTFPDSYSGRVSRQAFYGIGHYNANPGAYTTSVKICTPITSDSLGNLYFGYVTDGTVLPGLDGSTGGLARISSTGVGSYVSAKALSGGVASIKKVVYNCAPALSPDGSTVYIAVNNVPEGGSDIIANGYLCAANSQSLAMKAAVKLLDPHTGNAANLPDDGTASPTVGPDGDVYFGVLEDNVPNGNNDRGWLIHFDATLAHLRTPGAFGWDDTASIVPSTAVPSYKGPSKYLVLTKYNNYADLGTGDGQNKLAVLDPNVTETDPISGLLVMKEVLTVLGVTPDGGHPNFPNALREWCINSAAIDPITMCAVVNSEDGHVYRWDFKTNTLSAGLSLAPPTGEAYTPTVIGPDGSVYAINNATLFCVDGK